MGQGFTVESSGARKDMERLVYFAVGAAWAAMMLGVWHQIRREEARRRVRDISSRLLAQVFPPGVRP